MTFAVPEDTVMQQYSGTVTVQAIDSIGTVHTATAEITVEIAPEGAGFSYWVRTHLPLVVFFVVCALIGLFAIATFVKRRH